MLWIVAAVLSAFFAGLTSILAKCGIKKTDSDVATAERTIVVLVFSWIMVLVTGGFGSISAITPKTLIFLCLSGAATGCSWICYFKALSIGEVNKVVPVDKSSTVLTVIFAMIFFNEIDNLWAKIIGTVFLSVGIFLMIDKKKSEGKETKWTWFIYAVLSAIFASLTSILGKIGVSGVDSNLGTAIRTIVVLFFAWIIVFARKKQYEIKKQDKKELLFIVLSGIATGGSWLFYYYAIKHGNVSVVAPIDKSSILVSILFSRIVFKEKLSKRAIVGLVIMCIGIALMVIFA